MAEAPEPTRNNVRHMRDAVLFEGPTRGQKLSRFWILLILSSVIAAAGIVANSTATVIGAMIVAPMMLPIQGTMLATVLGDRVSLLRSIALVVFGAAASVGVGFLVGLVDPNPVVAATNSQVAQRVSPDLIDLLAALATGLVGSIALIRRDISDTLPGVAIAISLVPPLAVVGLTMESGAFVEALGALLLFVTNVAAILATGVVVMALYRVHSEPDLDPLPGAGMVNRRKAVIVIAAMLVLVGVPLTVTSVSYSTDTARTIAVQTVATNWAKQAGWSVVTVVTSQGESTVRATGPMPLPETASLASGLTEANIDVSTVHVELVPSYLVQLSG